MTERNTSQVSLSGKIHHAHPTNTVFNPTRRERIPQPLCGQRSRRFYPCYTVPGHEVTCEKCLAAAAGH